jgi:hypothetical protein
MSDDSERLLSFYAGTRPDDHGRWLSEIQLWSDRELEQVHNYIQWLFPLAERSGFNVDAPILDAKVIEEFRSRSNLRHNLQTSFRRMLGFYGLEIEDIGELTVVRAPSFAERAENWISPSNHNHLRITRILKSLKLLGLESEADAFFECLADIYRVESAKAVPKISEVTFRFWQSAAG